MTKHPIGRISIVQLREVFPEEHRDFTPWLMENVNDLGSILGFDIKDAIREDAVVDFRCDIVAKDESERPVIIENQYGDTDHDHLGKIITYSAGKDAKIIIWIAEEFREEHQKALEWLNENSDPESGLSFFGVEIRAIRIGDSLPAPEFKIIVKPNNWERTLRVALGYENDTRRRYRQFWTEIVEAYHKLSPNSKILALAPSVGSYIAFGAGTTGVRFVWAIKTRNRLAIELSIDTGDENENNTIFDEISRHKEEIEKELGLQLKSLIRLSSICYHCYQICFPVSNCYHRILC